MYMKSTGKCIFCKKTFSQNGISKHLASCDIRKKENLKDENSDTNIFLIRASAGPFWVYFEINSFERLDRIDRFLRKLWVECCGHLSMFKIDDQVYTGYQDHEYDDKNLDYELKDIIRIGNSFLYEYDFGSTTYINLKCISERKGLLDDVIKVLARNELPDFRCETCDKPAKEICVECIYDEKGLLCESCADKHKCGEEFLLPVVNSPRMGICGYTGGD